MNQDCLHPRYIFIWLLYLFLRISSFLPYRVLIFLGENIGTLIRILSRKRRRIAEINLALCFPEMSNEQRERILIEHFKSLGITLFEFTIYLWSNERLKPFIKVEGLEHLQRALKKNKGVILFAAHFTTNIIGPRLLCLYTNLNVVYRKLNNKCMDHIIYTGAENVGIKLMPHDHLKTIITGLKKNIPIIYSPDQNFGQRHSIFVPFFGIPAATITATSRLSAIDNTPVLPISTERLTDKQGYRIVISESLDMFPTEDHEKDTIRINQLIEEQVRQRPMDYLWIHRRFKTRPNDEEPFYNN